MRRIIFVFLICFGLAALTARAAHTQVQLVLSADTAKPGDMIWAAVDLKMDAGWHTYWKNPGAAGMATEIKWQLPPGVTAGEIQWPLPKKLPPAEVTTYGYEDEVMLIVPLTIETNSNLPEGQITLKANVSWLECKDVCIPAKADVQVTLVVSNQIQRPAGAQRIDFFKEKLIESWKSKIPRPTPTETVSWSGAPDGDKRPLVYEWVSELHPEAVDFFSYPSEAYEIAKVELLPSRSATYPVRLTIKKFGDSWPTEIHGLLINYPLADSVTDNTEVRELNLNISEPSSSSASRTGATPVLPVMLLYAFIGGLILNIMPCVLPVIALKILGFVSEAKSSPRRVRALGGIYAVGVLFSFLILAAIVISVKAAGHQAGWGMQFGSPIFVVCLTTLVTLVALNLFGVFEVTLGGKTLDAAGNLASKHGASGAFFNGVLATTLATPCTAPFLAPALGFAFSQSAATIIFIFLTVGLGLASPYVLLSWNPAWLKFLPKPGAWMEKFKIAMGFPMLATVVWLFNVASDDYGPRVFWLGVFLVSLAFATWIFGEFVQRGRKRKGIALAIILILLAGSYAYALENKLHWRDMINETDATSLAVSSGGIDWQRWSPEAVAQARAAGKPVLVDFTASWCVTCNAIVKPALEYDSVSAKLKEINAVAFLADYTRTPPLITAEIAKYGGAGVPLVLVYPKNPDAAAVVLPQPSPLQLPSGYRQIVLDALDRAAR